MLVRPHPRPDGHGIWAENGTQVPFFAEFDTGSERLEILIDKTGGVRAARWLRHLDMAGAALAAHRPPGNATSTRPWAGCGSRRRSRPPPPITLSRSGCPRPRTCGGSSGATTAIDACASRSSRTPTPTSRQTQRGGENTMNDYMHAVSNDGGEEQPAPNREISNAAWTWLTAP